MPIIGSIGVAAVKGFGAFRGIAIPAVTDPQFSTVGLLMHMNGTNNSTSFVDNSSNNFTVTVTGDAKMDTSVVALGSASATFNGTNAVLTVPNNAALALGTGDFTVEFRLNSNTTVNSFRRLVGSTNGAFTGTTFMMRFNASGNISCGNISYAWTLTTGQWYSLAFVRSGTKSKLYIDGVEVASASDTTNYEAIRYIGGWYTLGDTEYYNGHMDELRISKYARYTANYTPAVVEFPNS